MSLIDDPSLRPEKSMVIQTAYLIPNGPTMGNIEAMTAQGASITLPARPGVSAASIASVTCVSG